MKRDAPAGFHTITPRIVTTDPAGLIAFLKTVFGASADDREGGPSQVTVGDSRILISPATDRAPFPAFLYVYVADADATCQRALKEGGESIEAVWNTPYGDRRGMVRDPWNNVWQIAAYRK